MYTKRAWLVLVLLWILKKFDNTDVEAMELELDRAKTALADAYRAQAQLERDLTEEKQRCDRAEQARRDVLQRAQAEAQRHRDSVQFQMWLQQHIDHERLSKEYRAHLEAEKLRKQQAQQSRARDESIER